MGDRQRLFRGENAKVWERRLVERYQWPEPLAAQLALFLVGAGPLPPWPPEDRHVRLRNLPETEA